MEMRAEVYAISRKNVKCEWARTGLPYWHRIFGPCLYDHSLRWYCWDINPTEDYFDFLHMEKVKK